MNDLVDPGPSRTFVFLDEREDVINTGNFFVMMDGFADRPELAGFSTDYPASYHNLAGSLSFADGHVEAHRWADGRTVPPLGKNEMGVRRSGIFSSPNNADIRWLQERATRKLN
jgi:prepilin-type processing-associated H-X9-DG protein